MIRKTLANLSAEEVNPDTINWIVANSVDRDLEDIREDGAVKTLIIYSSTSYFLYRGQPMGFEYELPDNYREMKWANLQKELIHDPIELTNDTVSIRQNSAYSERMRSLSNEIGGWIHIDTFDSNLSTDQIIKMVIDGKIKYTIADENLAKINAGYNPILKIDVPVSFSQRIAWVTRKKSPQLRKAVNEWILSERKRTNYNVTYNKYFKNKRNFRNRARSEFYSLNNRQISQYDDLIKTYARDIDWDWRLLASKVYQESRFDPKADSWAGAKCLMQVMPNTAESLGIKNLTNPVQSIRGGVSYLGWLYENFEDVPDSLTRIKFMLAAYNCGYGHMRDAQRLAETKNLDPTSWDDNVESIVLALSDPENFNDPIVQHGYVRGEEPVYYVNEILKRCEQYKQFIPE